MKKIFLFAAAAIAALTVNAKVIDFATVGTSIDDWNPGSQATLNATESDEAKGKYVYDIPGGEDPNITTLKAESGIEFQTKNGSKKEKAFSIYPGKCFEFGGKNGILKIVGTKEGDKILLTVAAKGDSKDSDFTDGTGAFPKNAFAVTEDLLLPKKGSEGGDEQGYVWRVIEFESLGGDVEIKEFINGYRIKALQIGGEQAVDNVNAAVKAEKFFRNGQLIIRKNGVEYNALGAQL